MTHRCIHCKYCQHPSATGPFSYMHLKALWGQELHLALSAFWAHITVLGTQRAGSKCQKSKWAYHLEGSNPGEIKWIKPRYPGKVGMQPWQRFMRTVIGLFSYLSSSYLIKLKLFKCLIQNKLVGTLHLTSHLIFTTSSCNIYYY